MGIIRIAVFMLAWLELFGSIILASLGILNLFIALTVGLICMAYISKELNPIWDKED